MPVSVEGSAVSKKEVLVVHVDSSVMVSVGCAVSRDFMLREVGRSYSAVTSLEVLGMLVGGVLGDDALRVPA